MKSPQQPNPIEIRRLTADAPAQASKHPSNPPTSPGRGLGITWSNGQTSRLDSRTLRVSCPCAECLGKRGDTTHSKPLSGRLASLPVISSTAEEETDLVEAWPVGNYALGIRWADGHSTGIYTYDDLRSLAEKQEKILTEPEA